MEEQIRKVNKKQATDALVNEEVLGAIMRVALDLNILEEGQGLSERTIKETVLRSLGTQSFINKQWKENNQLYIETPNRGQYRINKKNKYL